jgi:hypothetical protein
MPSDFGPTKLKLTKGDVRVRTRGNSTAIAWKDRRHVYLLTYMDLPPEEGNFCDDGKGAAIERPKFITKVGEHFLPN